VGVAQLDVSGQLPAIDYANHSSPVWTHWRGHRPRRRGVAILGSYAGLTKASASAVPTNALASLYPDTRDDNLGTPPSQNSRSTSQAIQTPRSTGWVQKGPMTAVGMSILQLHRPLRPIPVHDT
jgi:hypothetical protein